MRYLENVLRTLSTIALAFALAAAALAEPLPPRFETLARIAEEGDPDALYFLGRHLFEQASDPDSAALARDFLTRSARQDHPQAMLLLGQLLEVVDARRGEINEALNWYARAAELGLAEAQLRLGNFHLQGRGGLEQDCGEALRWYGEAADRGLDVAESNTVWLLATCPDDTVRDGREALRQALHIVYRRGRDDAVNLDNLAAAFAEVGDFRSAWETQEDAIALIDESDPDWAAFQAHLDRYRQRKPWRESAETP